MNLKLKEKKPWLNEKHIKFIAIYIALALVLAINQVVFSYLLKDREIAKAMSNTSLGNLFIPLGSSSVEAGSNNGLAGEFLMPDAWVTDKPGQTCSFRLDDLSNNCMTLVDADGTATAGAGVVADGAKIAIWDWVAPGGNVAGEIFNAGDKLCTDNLVTPTCIYVDSDGDCLSSGAQTYILGAGCAAAAPAPADTPVMSATTPQWYHTELVNANGQYDYSVILGNSEAIWIDRLKADDVLYQGSDWNQAFPNQWQGDALSTWSAQDTFIDANANGHFDSGETIITDKDLNGAYTTQPTSLAEADGTASLGWGNDDDHISDGTTLTLLANTDHVCANSLGLYGEGSIISPEPIIMYVDGGSGAPGPLGPPDCIPGNGGTDVVLRNDIGAGDNIANNVGVFPHAYFSGAGIFLYYDANLNGHWDYGNSEATTESLWINVDSLGLSSIAANWSPDLMIALFWTTPGLMDFILLIMFVFQQILL
ncbi:MAG: hypothetical protein NT116_00925 [Candidatus Parcubacteria bacterium]|nr:hypothetical protein [Candidatus Parcubacteria bacterium]